MPKKKRNKIGTSNDQHVWKEILVRPEILVAPSEDADNVDNTEPERALIKEAKLLVGELLFDRVNSIATDEFTLHQRIVLALYLMPGRTYNEVAEILREIIPR